MEELNPGEKVIIAALLAGAAATVQPGMAALFAGIMYSIADKLDLRDLLTAHANYLGRMDALAALVLDKTE
jgi:hypothetical protein